MNMVLDVDQGVEDYTQGDEEDEECSVCVVRCLVPYGLVVGVSYTVYNYRRVPENSHLSWE